MGADDKKVTAARVARLVADASRISDTPIGAHLDDEEFYGLANKTLSDPESLMTHLKSCPKCSKRAVNVFRVFEKANQPVAATLPAPAPVPALSPRDRLVWGLVNPVVANFVTSGGVPRRSGALQTRDLEWKHSDGVSCAIEAIGDRTTFVVQAKTKEWSLRPLRCVISDAGSEDVWSDAWVILYPVPRKAPVLFEGRATLEVHRPIPASWNASIGRGHFDPARPPGQAELKQLRAVIDTAPATHRPALTRWFDEEVRAGRLAQRLRELLPKT